MFTEIKSARTGFIKTLFAAHGSKVATGEIILEYDDGLDRCTALHLDILEAGVQAMEERLGLGRLDDVRASLASRLLGAEAEVDYRLKEYISTKAMVDAGMFSVEDTVLMEPAHASAKFALKKAELQLAAFDSLYDAVPDQLGQMRAVWEQKKLVHEKWLAGNKHGSPGNGTIFWEIFENGFAEEGTVIGLLK